MWMEYTEEDSQELCQRGLLLALATIPLPVELLSKLPKGDQSPTPLEASPEYHYLLSVAESSEKTEVSYEKANKKKILDIVRQDAQTGSAEMDFQKCLYYASLWFFRENLAKERIPSQKIQKLFSSLKAVLDKSKAQ